MALEIMNFITSTLDAYLIFYFIVRHLSIKSINKRKTILGLLFAIILNTLINHIFGLANLLGFIIMFTILVGAYLYILDEKLHKILISSITAIIVMFSIEIIVSSIIIILSNHAPSDILSLNVIRIMGIIIAKSGFYIVIKPITSKLKVLKNYNFKESKPIILIGIFNLIIIFMTITLFKYMKDASIKGYIYLISMVLGAIIFSWIIYRVTKDMMNQKQKEEIWKIKEEEFYKGNFYTKHIKDVLDSIKSQRHDLNNYLSTLYGLIYLESFDEAKEYIGNLNNRINNLNTIVETNNPVISALVSVKKNKAFENNIKMNLDIDLPEKLPFDIVDLSIVIGNLLDNALEACIVVKEELEKNIDVLITVEDENLLIDISNTKKDSIKVDTHKIFGRFTTKKDKYNHGLGLSNIRYIVDQYHGNIDIRDLGNIFRVKISLPIEGDCESELGLLSNLA